MGSWAKALFGQDSFADIGIVVAGINTPEFEKLILGFFDKVVSSKDAVYHGHLAIKDGKAYLIVFNVYGAPALVDVMTEMHDGGCRNLIFVGYAYGGFQNLEIGTVVLPDKSYHFEGIFHVLHPDRREAFPDGELQSKIKEFLEKVSIVSVSGTNISVPAVTFQLPHANEEYQRIKPTTLEMELAACYARAKDLGVRASGLLVISDNKDVRIGDKTKQELRYKSKVNLLKSLIENISAFSLPHLPAEPFDVDTYLASVVEEVHDVTSVYRED